jgi:hypothetical protein
MARTIVDASDAASPDRDLGFLRRPRGRPEPRDEEAGPSMNDLSAEEQLAGFMDKFTPEIAAQTRAVLAKMRSLLPGSFELVYDNYNALVVGFGPTDRASEALFSIAVYPRWISLFFLHGSGLSDPGHLLQGGGKSVRHIVLNRPENLDVPAVRTLMAQALKRSSKPLDPRQPRRIVVKSIATKQRPRRPV